MCLCDLFSTSGHFTVALVRACGSFHGLVYSCSHLVILNFLTVGCDNIWPQDLLEWWLDHESSNDAQIMHKLQWFITRQREVPQDDKKGKALGRYIKLTVFSSWLC